jgi:hypothetical protein
MATINGISYSSTKDLFLKGGAKGPGTLLFSKAGSPSGFTSTPFDSSSNGLYINSANQLVYSSQGVTTIIGAASGGGSIAIPYSSTDGISTTGQSFSINASTLTSHLLLVVLYS